MEPTSSESSSISGNEINVDLNSECDEELDGGQEFGAEISLVDGQDGEQPPSFLPSAIQTPRDNEKVELGFQLHYQNEDGEVVVVPIPQNVQEDLRDIFSKLYLPAVSTKTLAEKIFNILKPSLKKGVSPILLIIGLASPLVCVPLSKDTIERMLNYFLPDFLEKHPFFSYLELALGFCGTTPLMALNTSSLFNLYRLATAKTPSAVVPYSEKNGKHWYDPRKYGIHGVRDGVSDLLVLGGGLFLLGATLNSATSNAYLAVTKIPPYFPNWEWLQISLKVFLGATGLLGPWANNFNLSLCITNAILEQRYFRRYLNPTYHKLVDSYTRYDRGQKIAAINEYLRDMKSLVQHDLDKKECSRLFAKIFTTCEIEGEKQVQVDLDYLFQALAPENFGNYRKGHLIKYAVTLFLAIVIPSTSGFYYVRTGASAGKFIIDNKYVDALLGWAAFAINSPILWYVAFPVLMKLGIGTLSEIAIKYFWSLMQKSVNRCLAIEGNDRGQEEDVMLDVIIEEAAEGNTQQKSTAHSVANKIVFTFKNGVVRPALVVGAAISAASTVGATLTTTLNPAILGSAGFAQFFLGIFGNNAAMRGLFGESRTPQKNILLLISLLMENVSKLDDQHLDALYKMVPEEYQKIFPLRERREQPGEYCRLVDEDNERNDYGSVNPVQFNNS